MAKTMSDLEKFNEQGYLVLDLAFSQEELNAFRLCLKQIIRIMLNKTMKEKPELGALSKDQELEEGMLLLKKHAPHRLAEIQRIISRTPEFYRLIANVDTISVLKKLCLILEDHPTYISNSGVIFTFPHNQGAKESTHFEADWHTDVFYTIPRSRFIHYWAPLIYDATEEIGTLKVCAGSHQAGLTQQLIHIHEPYNHRYSVPHEIVARYPVKSVPVKLGQLLIFADHLIHRSGINTSHRIRYSLTGLCHDVAYQDFIPFSTEYKYYGETPEAYFYELFQDEDAKSIMHDQAAFPGEPRGGI